MSRKIIILENIRSAYNVGNVIRTADALGREVRITGYTPSPLDHPKVKKTSLGAEESVPIMQFDYSSDAINYARKQQIPIIAAEITPDAIDLTNFSYGHSWDIAIIFGNEVEGVLPDTLKSLDHIVYIPMQWTKESLNIGQSTAIFMRALR